MNGRDYSLVSDVVQRHAIIIAKYPLPRTSLVVRFINMACDNVNFWIAFQARARKDRPPPCRHPDVHSSLQHLDWYISAWYCGHYTLQVVHSSPRTAMTYLETSGTLTFVFSLRYHFFGHLDMRVKCDIWKALRILIFQKYTLERISKYIHQWLKINVLVGATGIGRSNSHNVTPYARVAMRN